MFICGAGDIHGAINSFYEDVLTSEISLGVTFDWVLHVGDFGIWPCCARIAVDGGVVLEVAGPALECGRPVGWSFSPSEARPGVSGEYEGLVCGAFGVGMERRLAIRLGDTVVRISSGRASCAPGDSCRFDIDPDAIQVWPLA